MQGCTVHSSAVGKEHSTILIISFFVADVGHLHLALPLCATSSQWSGTISCKFSSVKKIMANLDIMPVRQCKGRMRTYNLKYIGKPFHSFQDKRELDDSGRKALFGLFSVLLWVEGRVEPKTTCAPRCKIAPLWESSASFLLSRTHHKVNM